MSAKGKGNYLQTNTISSPPNGPPPPSILNINAMAIKFARSQQEILRRKDSMFDAFGMFELHRTDIADGWKASGLGERQTRYDQMRRIVRQM